LKYGLGRGWSDHLQTGDAGMVDQQTTGFGQLRQISDQSTMGCRRPSDTRLLTGINGLKTVIMATLCRMKKKTMR